MPDQYESTFNKLYNATLVCLKTQPLLTGSKKKHAKKANVSIKTDFISTTHDKKNVSMFYSLVSKSVNAILCISKNELEEHKLLCFTFNTKKYRAQSLKYLDGTDYVQITH